MSSTDERKEQIAQEQYGKPFSELDPMDRIKVGGQVGGETRREKMSEEHGGDTHAAYAEMGKQGGEARKEQMTEEGGGDTSKAYAEMGSKGGQTIKEMAEEHRKGAGSQD